VDVLIAADDAAAIECGESEETNDAHTTTLAVGSPTGAAMGQPFAASRRCVQPMSGLIAKYEPVTDGWNGGQSVRSLKPSTPVLQTLRTRLRPEMWVRAKKRHIGRSMAMDR
jgi:hypothetical protein